MPFDGSRLSQEARLLITARARISEDGWCQRAFRDGKDQWCLMAALGYDGMLVPLIRSRKSYRYRALERVIEAISPRQEPPDVLELERGRLERLPETYQGGRSGRIGSSNRSELTCRPSC
jgi:hypothetical protein